MNGLGWCGQIGLAAVWLVCVGVPVCRADVVLNEIQSANDSTLLDADGAAADWIELLNRGSTGVDLGGWGLSDRTNAPMKWVFPQRPLGPGQRLVVFASGKDRTNALDVVPLGSPQEVPGLVVWLRAEGSDFTNGAKVAAWPDLSGLGNHATQTVVSAQPAFVTNAVNGRPALRFTKASSQQLLLPVGTFNGMASLRDLTVMLVCRWSGGATPSGMFGAWGSSANTHFEINGGGELRIRVAAADSVRTSGTMTNSVWCQIGGTMRGAGDAPLLSSYRDGILRGTLSRDPGSALLSGYTTMGIGNSDSTTRFFNGDIAEVLIFNRALPVAEREAVERYLAERYGLPFQGGAALPELHTSFSLDADGETVVLTRPDASTADRVEVPAVPADAAFGRMPDGTGAFAYLAAPTPGAANVGLGYTAPQAKPDFSRKRGICDAPFTLAITPDDPLAQVYYTLDASEPSPTNGALFAAPFAVTNTTVVRAVAYREGALPRRAIATHTYLFLEDVLAQTNRPAGYPADWNGYAYTSYAVSANVAEQPGYADAMRAALRAAPVLSLSLSKEDLFGANGVYANPLVDGFERAVSAEWLTNGVSYTQVEAGLRVQGGASRVFSNTPKKSLRLLFKEVYGDGRLKKPVLAEGGGTPLADFNSLILRAEYNNAWTHNDGTQRPRGTNARDQWVRDTQTAMSGTGSHGNHVHLFLNGLYWGLYNVAERPDAAFAANYFGGESEEYDAMTPDGVRDGDNVAWNAMHNIAKAGLADTGRYEAIRQYLDVDHLIDYMMINFYGGNNDWPHHNWNAVRRRETGAGYRFYCWDSERTLEGTNENRVAATFTSGPAYLHTALCTNVEYRLRFADRVHRGLFNGGALTPAAAAERYAARAGAVERAVFGEAARWGAYRKEVVPGGAIPRYGTNEWGIERSRLLTGYFPVRTAIMLNQFRAAGLYPAVAAPEFSQHGGALEYGETLAVTNAAGTVYLTFDGCDPRVAYSGEAASNAVVYAGPFALTNTCVVKARALNNGVWSALTEATFGVVVSEPHFLLSGDGDWGVASNWFGAVVPTGAGQRVRIPVPTANRNVNLRAPVTVGRIAFDHAGNPFRNRVRDRDSGNALTFDGGATNACIAVTGDGVGYAEFEVGAGVCLLSDVVLQVGHLGGNDEYGALRLRERWSGAGGLRKTGPGVASLTGENKVFTGAVAVEEGVLKVTGSAAPAQAAGVTVGAGGQLRLYSDNASGASNVVYAFGGTVTLSGYGRGAEIPDSSGQGKLGALRYDPGTQSNTCVLAAPVVLSGEADIHVDGSQNRLALSGGLGGGARLVKTGGGVLELPAGVALTAAVEVANGAVAFGGAAALGALSGTGAVRVDGQVVTAVSFGGAVLEARLRQPGEAAAGVNGYLKAGGLSAPPGVLRLYLEGGGALYRGALYAPYGADLSAAVRGAPREVYVADAAGGHLFGGARWRLSADAQVVAVPVRLGAGEEGRMVEVRLDAAPASYEAWRRAAFTNAAEYADEAVSGPLAAPRADGVRNLTRYAFGLALSAPAALARPTFAGGAEGWEYRFPFEPWRDDLAYVVDASDEVADWSGAEVLFDSRAAYPEGAAEGWLSLRDTAVRTRRFYRLRLILSGAE